MPPEKPRRKVLIVEDEPSIRNVLYVLLAGLGCDGDVAYGGRMALSMIEKEKFDAVLLDVRSSELQPEEVMAKIKELRPQLVGRVLVITGEVADRATLETLERYCLQAVPRHRVMDDLWARLRSLLGLAPSSPDSIP